jgi:ATP-dependent DNA helicase RecG
MSNASPKSPLEAYSFITGAPKTLLPRLRSLCGERWIDLLLHLPTHILDRRATPTIAETAPGSTATWQVMVSKHVPKPYPRHRRPHIVHVADDSGKAQLVFFQAASWLEKALPVGETVLVSGQMEETGKIKKMIHPTLWGTKRDLGDIAKLWPMYPLTQGLSHIQLKRVVDTALQHFTAADFPEWLGPHVVKKHKFISSYKALTFIHNPQKEKDIEPDSPARLRLAFDELFAHQLALIHARRTTRQHPGIAHGQSDMKRQKFFSNLAFTLTNDQNSALIDIDADLTEPQPMLRLLQGDVGSGKTVVAIAALLRVIENGSQGVMMAPTEILARQHYENAKKWLEPLGITVALLVGSVPAGQKKRLKQHIQEGFANLIIGTHALVQDDVHFNRLGLVVVDEQHRFGVEARLKLTTHNTDGLAPDVLVMTATPIPRTLALTYYGDMDVSVIREKPPGRTPVATHVLPTARLEETAQGLQRIIDKGEQVYWVCPLVEENEDSDLSAATARFKALQVLYGKNVALLHGKMKAAEKEAVMGAFKAGEAKILVATTVIEVGVDVPQATVMIIEQAERFGLSQLHQLRGRVGRGKTQSTCLLLYTPPLTSMATTRLQAMRESDDGFELAEKDMDLRGPGEVLGTRQAGAVATRVADLVRHKALIPLAREAAEQTLASKMPAEQRRALWLLLRIFNKDAAAELLKAG